MEKSTKLIIATTVLAAVGFALYKLGLFSNKKKEDDVDEDYIEYVINLAKNKDNTTLDSKSKAILETLEKKYNGNKGSWTPTEKELFRRIEIINKERDNSLSQGASVASIYYDAPTKMTASEIERNNNITLSYEEALKNR